MKLCGALMTLAGLGTVMLIAGCSGNSDSGPSTSTVDPAPDRPECIAPSAPGGGFDLTCKLAQKSFQETGLMSLPIRITYLPGGIGAVAMNTIIAQRPADSNVLVAFSSGSLLNLAQGKFGRYTETDVRWVAAVGVDYGMIAVRADSPLQNLGDLISLLQDDPTAIVFGAGGTVGSQDWMKSAMIARAAGVDYKAIRYVPFEGGGEAQIALLGGHIQVYSGDISEVRGILESGRLRVLAVMSEETLPPPYAEVPTATEQGYEISWPVLRGYYTGPDVSEDAYRWWVERFDSLLASEGFAEIRGEFGVFPFARTGAELAAYIEQRMVRYRTLVEEFGLDYQE